MTMLTMYLLIQIRKEGGMTRVRVLNQMCKEIKARMQMVNLVRNLIHRESFAVLLI